MKTLDITDMKEQGKDLYDAITNAVKDTQLFIAQPLPHEIEMTQDQYEQIAYMSGLDMDIEDAENRYVRTELNVMEIKIKGEVNDETRESED